jgi:hypothetical protein
MLPCFLSGTAKNSSIKLLHFRRINEAINGKNLAIRFIGAIQKFQVIKILPGLRKLVEVDGSCSLIREGCFLQKYQPVNPV